MRKVNKHIDTVKEKTLTLKGSNVKLLINKGRKKYITLTGCIVDVYPSVFTVKIEGSRSLTVQSYSFSDVLTGDVKLKVLHEQTS